MTENLLSQPLIDSEYENNFDNNIIGEIEYINDNESKTSDDDLNISSGNDDLLYRNPRKSSYKKIEFKPSFYRKWIYPRFNKGFMSNFITFMIMIIGFFLKYLLRHNKNSETPLDYIIAFGLFGFAGGITNWLAIKMLFDKVPFLYGSGIIPRKFREIRETIKNTIMASFFNKNFLKNYLENKLSTFIKLFSIEDKIKQLIQSPSVDHLIDLKLEELKQRPEGKVLSMVGLEPAKLKPLILPFIGGFGNSLSQISADAFGVSEVFNAENLRKEIDNLMTEKLKELTPQAVKALLEKIHIDIIFYCMGKCFWWHHWYYF
ncbi:hypothetical protein M0811_13615 [Anaeramoeba ignava]|uniref:DUF445 family protein n=1 Tax=Anaeramoeba ignava TaxID=1746090 RepID=A0A9Q0R450_ANAIG|nr:hypothetical protein M0811_13615 [Anaeramoeba ignava]